MKNLFKNLFTRQKYNLAFFKRTATFSLSFLFFILFSTTATAQNISVSGKVTGPSGIGLAGASVDAQGSTNGTSTDGNGNYTISVPSNGSLVFSYVGYSSQTIAVAGRTTINVSLLTNTKTDDAVVVIGYGTARKIDLTGSVGQVKGADIARQPNNNPIASIQGKVAGVTIVNSGVPGSSPTVRIRGINSTNNSGPLYVVDGIFQSSIDYLNPGDIESIDILKDPSSIAIFGLRGGNGVIVVTTKKAARGKTRINFQTQAGIQVVQKKIDVVDAAGFKQLYDTQLKNINAAPFDYTSYKGNTNFQDAVLRKAFFNNNSLSISNTGDKTSTVFNLGYNSQEGVVRNGKFEKFVVRFNQEVKINSALRVGGEITGFYYNTEPANTSIINALRAAPIIPIKSPEGYYYSTPSFQRAQVGNPLYNLQRLDGTSINKGYRTVGNVFAELKFAQHFTMKSTFYADLAFNGSRGYSPLANRVINLGEGPIKTDTTRDNSVRTSVRQSEANFRTFQQDHVLTYDNTIASDHHINALVGFTTVFAESVSLNGNRTDTSLNIPNDPNLYYLDITNGSNPGNYGGGGGQNAQLAYFSRVQYSYKNRYLLNANVRRDGNSIYSPTNHYQTYGGVGVGWIISKESFFENIKAFDYLKLRAAYGTVGNGLGAGNYLFAPVLNLNGVGVFGNNVYTGVQPAYTPSPTLHPEIVVGEDVGLEWRAIKNRLNGELTFYRKETKGILTTYVPPGASGGNPVLDNLGNIENKGIELSLGWNDKIGSDFSYSLSANGSYNKNKTVNLGPGFNFTILGNDGVNKTTSGQSIGYFYGYKQVGIYQTTADLVKMPSFSNSLPGDIAYADINGDGKITPEDRTYLGSPFPTYNFGGNVTLGYKDFDFSVDVNGVAGNKIFLQRRTANFATLNYETNRLNAWTAPGTTNIEPILDNTRANNFLFSNYYLEKGDYFRIRNVQVGYTFRQKALTKIGIQSGRFYVSGQNVATFSYVSGYTPEVDVSSPTGGGADNGSYPVPSTYSVGLNLIF